MDNINSKHNRAIMSLNFPIFANEDGSMSTLVKLSMSSRQLDENSEIVVDLKPASEFMPLEEYRTAKGNEKKNSIKSFISDTPHPRIGIIENSNHKNNENDINNKVLRVSWELEQKNTCIPSCEDECQENLSSTNLQDSQKKLSTSEERVKLPQEKLISSGERIEPSQEKLISSEDQETQVLAGKVLANEKKGNQKYALNTKSPLYFKIHNESIICTKEPDGILDDADETIWINSYYDDEMTDLRNKFRRMENDIKDFDSTVLRKIDMEASYIFDEKAGKDTNIKWNLQRQLEIVFVDKDIKIDRHM